jgi:hypothetical protein
MSVGKINSYVDKGNNFPWQFKMLNGLQAIANALSGSTNGQARRAGVERVSAAFVSLVNVYSFSVANVGTANGTVAGVTIKPGEILNYDAGGINNYFAAGDLTADGTGTELLISYIY